MGSATSRLVSSKAVTNDEPGASNTDGALLPFPPEVIDHLLAPLSRADLVTLLRVNSAFHDAVAWRMARRVHVLEESSGYLKLEARTEPRRGDAPRIVKRFLPQWVDTVELHPHSAAACDNSDKGRWSTNTGLVGGLRSLTSVRVVRVHFDDTSSTLHTTPSSGEARPGPDADRCVLTKAPYMFSGHTVVLRNPRNVVMATPALRRVYVLGSGLVGTQGTHLSTLWLGAMGTRRPPQEITIVFAAPPRTEWWPVPTTRYAEWAPLRKRWLDRCFDHLLVSLFELLGDPEGEVTRLLLVNAEAISLPGLDDMQQTALPGAWNTRQEHIETMFRSRMATALPPNPARRAAVARAVSFLGMREWVAEGKWKDVFDYDEIAEWMPESEGAW